jgi:hypothetical protein
LSEYQGRPISESFIENLLLHKPIAHNVSGLVQGEQSIKFIDESAQQVLFRVLCDRVNSHSFCRLLNPVLVCVHLSVVLCEIINLRRQ